MDVLLTRVAHDRFWPLLADSAVVPLLMERDGSLRRFTGEVVDFSEATPEVAWCTSDLFAPDAPLRPFFGLARRVPSLRWFQSPAAGFDDPVFAAMASRGVQITNSHVNGIPIAEYVLRAVLDHFQGAARWRDAQVAGRWQLHDFREVAGTTWLVVGLGSIGGGVARRAAAFEARVIGCRRHPAPADPTERTVTPQELPAVVGDADVVVLAAPSTPQTVGMVDDAFLRAMRPGSVLVNVARGSLVVEDALLAALDRGVPEAAVLDVFATEPLPPAHPLWQHPAVTVTPHNAAGGTGRLQRQASLFADNLARYLAGEPLRNDITDVVLRQRSGGDGPPEDEPEPRRSRDR